MAKAKSALGNPNLKPCKNKKPHGYHHHTEGGGFNYCDGVRNSEGYFAVEGWKP